MERENEQRDELIDLGSVVEETKGAVRGGPDFIGLPLNQTGIMDD
ncbi:benenodin family lasso peptide [Sphingobium sp. V4]|nr:benenodin family lasso peptide [Sphingobium sp. V4]WIW89566.1 benenodin family lasso peptide [Sphingobium sp. V4]